MVLWLDEYYVENHTVNLGKCTMGGNIENIQLEFHNW